MVRTQVWESLAQVQVNSGIIEKISTFEDGEGVCEFSSLGEKR